VVEQVVSRLGKVELAFVTGDYAKGKDSGLIDLVLVGEIDKGYLQSLMPKLESIINRKIRHLALTHAEFEKLKPCFQSEPILVLWANGSGRF
jgi:hypothetical protein